MRFRSHIFGTILWLLILIQFQSNAEDLLEIPGARQPQVTLDHQGFLHIVYGREHSIFVVTSTNGAISFGPPVLIGKVEKLALGMRRGPRIVATPHSLVVTAISHAEGSLHSWISTDQGKSWSSSGVINDVEKSAREGLHALASNAKGELFSAWLDLRNGKTELWGSRGLQGGKTWEPNVRIYASPSGTICECCHPSLLIRDHGEIVAMWRNSLQGSRDMYLAKSSDQGRTFSGLVKLGNESWRLNACPMDGGHLAFLDGRLVTAWRRDKQLFFAREGQPENLLTQNGTQPVVVAAEDRLEYFWQSEGAVFRRNPATGLAEKMASEGGYPAAAWSPKLKKTLLVWESKKGVEWKWVE